MALKELNGSRREVISIDGIRAEREFICDWDERDDVSPRIGDIYPFCDDPEMYVCEIERDPFSHATGEGRDDAYAYCKLRITYTTRDPKKPVISLDTTAEQIQILSGRLWYSDGSPCWQHDTMMIPRQELVVDRAYWFLPSGLMFSMTGCVNYVIFQGCAPETVLFMGGNGRTEYTNLGEMVWRMRLRFMFRPTGWNWQWRNDGFGWDYPVPSVYSAADLNLLLL